MQRSQWEEETSGPRMNLPRVPCTSDNSTTSTAPLLQLHQNLQHTQRESKNIVEYDLNFPTLLEVYQWNTYHNLNTTDI